MIRIMVVDDHAMVRAGVCRILESEPDLKVVGQAGSGHDAVRLVREKRPDVVILDYGLPDLDGLEVTRQILDSGVSAQILILTMHGNEEYATRVIRAGASGFIVKVAPAEELIRAVRKVHARGVYVSPEIMERMVGRLGQPVEEIPESVLSNRELQVLLRLARGLSTREVADALNLSPSTIETYRSRIMEKLNLRNNSDMTRFAIRRRLIDVE